MKTGIVTFHSAYNFGASLQTWALQKSLELLGTEAWVINYRPAVIDDLYDPLAGHTGLRRSSFYRRLTDPVAIKRRDRYEKFLREKLHLLGEYRSYQELEKAEIILDACIAGSDQIWNVEHTGGYDPAYFLEFLKGAPTKISYAASVGTDYILPTYHQQFRRGLKGLDHISVRESSARAAVSSLAEREVEVVLDPTLLLSAKTYDAIKAPVEHREKYILVYMMEYNPDVIEYANYLSRLLGLPIVQRRNKAYFNHEIESLYTATPAEFLDYVEHAEYVVTNSFHGTVFSILFERPFVSMLHSGTGSRTADLLQSLGLEAHLLRDIQTRPGPEQLLIREKQKMRELLAQKRQHSLAFLQRALSGSAGRRS